MRRLSRSREPRTAKLYRISIVDRSTSAIRGYRKDARPFPPVFRQFSVHYAVHRCRFTARNLEQTRKRGANAGNLAASYPFGVSGGSTEVLQDPPTYVRAHVCPR